MLALQGIDWPAHFSSACPIGLIQLINLSLWRYCKILSEDNAQPLCDCNLPRLKLSGKRPTKYVTRTTTHLGEPAV